MVGWHHLLSGRVWASSQDLVKDKEVWYAADQTMVSQSQTQLSDWKTTVTGLQSEGS